MEKLGRESVIMADNKEPKDDATKRRADSPAFKAKVALAAHK